MNKFFKEEYESALKIVLSIIKNCEKIQLKFKEGTSQHTLLKNRIKALYIAKKLITGNSPDKYTTAELNEAIKPILSINNKSKKGQKKHESISYTYIRLQKIADAMSISLYLINNEINNRRH